MAKRNIPPEVLVAAQVIRSADPTSSTPKAAAEVGVTASALRHREPNPTPLAPDVSARAHALADRASALAKAEGGSLEDPDTRRRVTERLTDEVAVDHRKQVIERHRREWQAPRELMYGTINRLKAKQIDSAGAFDELKVAKIMADTIEQIHAGERLAHDIRAGDVGGLMIDRTPGGRQE